MHIIGHIIGLSGSMGSPSQSLSALEIALESAAEAGATVQLFDLSQLDIPILTPANFKTPTDDVRALCEAIRTADGMLWSTPLYHGSMTGAFKNALDWLEILSKDERPYLTGRVVGLICTAAGTQALQGINSMEFVARALRAWVAPLTAPISQAPLDEKTITILQQLGRDITVASARLKG